MVNMDEPKTFQDFQNERPELFDMPELVPKVLVMKMLEACYLAGENAALKWLNNKLDKK